MWNKGQGSSQTVTGSVNNKYYLMAFQIQKAVLSKKYPELEQSNYPLYLIVYQDIVTVTIRKCNTVLVQGL